MNECKPLLRGMQEEGLLDEALLEEYLVFCHDIPLHDHIGPDPQLRRMLEGITLPKWVFTASTVPHATRCLERLGIFDMFEAGASRSLLLST